MTSFAQELGLDRRFLRASIINRVAYAAAADTLGFPVAGQSDNDAEFAASLPISAPPWIKRAEAGTALQGAASASLVIDQLLAFKLIAEAATAYQQAGFLYGLFLAAGLGIPNLSGSIARMMLGDGVDVARQEYRSYADALINPIQLSYLTLSLAISGEDDLAHQFLDAPFFPKVSVPIGPTGIANTDLFNLALRGVSTEGLVSRHSQGDVIEELFRGVTAQLQWQRSAPPWRQSLPWYIGLDCDTALLTVAFGDQLESMESGVAGILRAIASIISQLSTNYLQPILEADLTDGIRIRLLQEDLSAEDISGEPTLWYQNFD